MAATGTAGAPRIGLLWRGDPDDPVAPEDTRFRRVFEEFAKRGAQAEAVVYDEAAEEAVRRRLLELEGVLVWVNPIVHGRDRAQLDALLREVADEGVFVSARPDVILRMGTKDVLYRTREMAWGSDTHRYETPDELRDGLLSRLRASGPRVLKQDRGSSGDGVWKVELVNDTSAGSEARIRVQSAERGAEVRGMRLDEFVEQRREYLRYFGGAGMFIDQPYADRLPEGMVRCYLVHDRVAGFGHQYVTALAPLPPGERTVPEPPPRLYYGAAQPDFQPLRARLEGGWIAEMQRVLGVDRESLPVIWDADFLLGPQTPADEDSYILCEINVSSVFPIPDESVAPLVEAALERVRSARAQRAGRP